MLLIFSNYVQVLPKHSEICAANNIKLMGFVFLTTPALPREEPVELSVLAEALK